VNPHSGDGLAARLAHLACRTLGLPVSALLRADPEGLARRVAALMDLADPGSVRAFRRNLAQLGLRLSPADRDSLARSMQRARARTILEMLAAPARDAQWLRARVAVTGLATLREALREGRGAVVIWNHLGIPDLGVRALAAHGLRTTAHADRPLGPVLWRGAVRARRAMGVTVVPRSAGPVPLIVALRRGELAAVVWDGHAPRQRDGGHGAGRGLQAATSLARRAGAPVFRAACLPDGRGFQLSVRGPHPAPPDAAAARRLACELTAAEARMLSEHLEHWGLNRALRWNAADLEVA
jgi:lauroyl/myristoyl acyltransferase